MVILTQYHTEIQNRGISTIGRQKFSQYPACPDSRSCTVHGKSRKIFGLSQQTFKALIQTNHGISELSLELLNEGYEYVLNQGRVQDC